MGSNATALTSAGAPVNPERRFLLQHIRFDRQIVRAVGHYLYDDAGVAYLDALAQYGAMPFGHNPAAIWERVRSVHEASEPSFVQPLLSPRADELAKKLLDVMPASMAYVTYVNSGAEATEAAIKMVRARTHRSLILSFAGGFHGKTTGALMCTGNPHYRESFLVDCPGYEVLPFGDLDGLRDRLLDGEVAGVIVEVIQGEGGMRRQPAGFMGEVSALCRQHGALLVIDEVQSGLGRSGTMFAFEQESGVEPDIVLLAKALGGGLMPLGALICNERSWTPAFGALHSSTFANGNLACAVGSAVLDELQRDDRAVVRHAKAMGERLAAGLAALGDRYPDAVEPADGRGLMQGLRLLPWDGADSYFAAHASQLGHAVPIVAGHLLNEHQVLTAPVFNHNNVLRIQPPLTVTADEVDRILGALDRVADLAQRHRYAELFAYMARTRVPAAAGAEPAPCKAAPAVHVTSERRGGFAFLIHPTDDEVLASTLPVELTRLDAAGQEAWQDWMHSWFAKMHQPAVVYHQPRIMSKRGGHVEGWLIASPLTPAQMLRLPRAKRELLLQQYVEQAQSLNVNIVGLGAFTSVISRGGTDIAGCGLNLTTGNSLTALASTHTLRTAVAHRGADPLDLQTTVIGAAGSVGRVGAIDMAEHFGRVDLIGNAQNPEAIGVLEEIAGEIYAHVIRRAAAGQKTGIAVAIGEALLARMRSLAEEAARVPLGQRTFLLRLLYQQIQEVLGVEAPLRADVDVRSAVVRSDVVLTATSASRAFIECDWLRPGAIVCDVSRPLNMLHELREHRGDVWVFEGGVMRLPEEIQFGRQNVLGYQRGINLACLSETITLAMEGASRHHSLGSRIDIEEAHRIAEAALGHGFRPYIELPDMWRGAEAPVSSFMSSHV